MSVFKKIAAGLIALPVLFLVSCTPQSEVPKVSELLFSENAQSEYVNWYGRTLFDNAKKCVIANNSASGFEVSFSGTELKMNYVSESFDNVRNQLGWLGDGYICVMVDGDIDFSDPDNFKRLPLSSEPAEFVLVENLKAGKHTVKVQKATEGICNGWAVSALKTDGTFHHPPPKPKHKIEIYGDSISAGNGAHRDSIQIEKGIPEQESAMRSYAYGAASLLNAEANVFAVSGGCIGAYPELFGANVIPALYEKYFPNCPDEKKYKWNFSLFVPDAVIIDLGTNDLLAGFSRGMDESALISSMSSQYKSFIEAIKLRYPETVVFVCCGVFNNLDPLNPVRIASYNDVFSDIAAEYDYVYFYEFDPCRMGHPNGEESEAYAKELAAFMDSVLKWRGDQ